MSDETTIASFFKRNCYVFEERPAIRFDTGFGLKQIPFTNLRRVVYQVAQGLIRIGIRPGDRILLWGENRPEWIIAFFAIQFVGAVDVSVDDDFSAAEAKQAYLKTKCKAAFLGVDKPQARFRNSYLLSFDHKPLVNMRNLLDRQEAKHRRIKNGLCSIVWQNDSTGVELTHNSILANIEASSSVLPVTENDDIVSTINLGTAAGRFALFLSLKTGSCLNMVDSIAKMSIFNPTIALGTPKDYEDAVVGLRTLTTDLRSLLFTVHLKISSIVDTSVNYFTNRLPQFRERSALDNVFTALTYLALLVIFFPLKLFGDLNFGLSVRKRLGKRLRYAIVGPGLVTQKTERFFSAIGVSVLEGYWKSEFSHLAALRIPEYTQQKNRIIEGTVGPILPGIEMKLIDAHGEDVSNIPGKTGTIYIRGKSLFTGYTEKGNKSKDEHGWFETGERGRLTLSGELQLLQEQT